MKVPGAQKQKSLYDVSSKNLQLCQKVFLMYTGIPT